MAAEPARPVFYRVDLTGEQADALLRLLARHGSLEPDLAEVAKRLDAARHLSACRGDACHAAGWHG